MNFRRGADLACGAIVLCGLNFNFGFLAFWCFKFLADFGVRILGACGANLVGEFWRTRGRGARRVWRGFKI